MSKDLKVITEKENTNTGIVLDYTEVDKETEMFIREATEKIDMLREKTQKSLGELFVTVKDKLGGENQYNGFFGKWYRALGFKKDFVYNCINYYELLIGNSENQKLDKVSFSKVCKLAKLKETPKLQKEVIEIAPLKKMKVKQVTELVNEVKSRNEVTEELIDEICNNTKESNIKLKKFVEATTSFIKDLKEQSTEISKDNIEQVLKLISEVQKLCSI